MSLHVRRTMSYFETPLCRMKTAIPQLPRLALCALTLSAFVFAATARANGVAAQALAEKKVSAPPLTHHIEKGTPGENGGPYAVVLKNTSNAALKLSATIIWSVASHNRAKTIELPARTLAGGETWTINDLAVEDRVIVAAEGFENLEVKVPPAKPAN